MADPKTLRGWKRLNARARSARQAHSPDCYAWRFARWARQEYGKSPHDWPVDVLELGLRTGWEHEHGYTQCSCV